MRRSCWLVVLLLAGCGGHGAVTEAAGGIPDPAALDAQARRGAVTETIFGQEVADPYRSLEEDTPETQAWIEGQTAATERYLSEHPDPAMAERIAHFLRIGQIKFPGQGGDRTFFVKREGDVDQGSLYVVGPDGTPRVLVDPNTLGERVAIDWIFPSPAGKFVAYGLSTADDERSVLHLVDVDTGHDLEERIAHTNSTSLSWLEDESGFYYTRYPREGEPDWSAEEEDSYFPHLFFHAVGAQPDGAEDPLAFRVPEKTDEVVPSVSPDDRWVVINVFHGWSHSDVLLLDRTAAGATPVPVDVGGDYLVTGEVHGDRLYLESSEDHPRLRIVAAPLATPADRTTWTEIVPEGEGTIEAWSFAADRLAVRYTENVADRLRLFAADGSAQQEIALPAPGHVEGPATQRRSDRVVYEFDTYFQPPTLYAFDPAANASQEVDHVASDLDPAQYEVTQETVSSADGTAIPVFVVRARDLPQDGARPTLVTGYGGIGKPLQPTFARSTLPWLERGGVFVEAALRGGSEFGEEWHRAGMLGNKHHVFEDFEAVLRWLPTTGLTSPEHIGIFGASNGGLLMGAMIVRCPDAFRAAVASHGLYDMVRYVQFPPAENWMEEYGDPSQPDAFAWLLAESPYHNVRDGTPYPSVLILTADHDTIVSPVHSTKFAARLQEATTSGRPVLFHMARSVGHGHATGLADFLDEFTLAYTFVETELGMR